MHTTPGEAYAGDITPVEAWSFLADEPSAQLVDVRTAPEWAYVGVPTLETLGKQPVLLQWQVYPAMEVATDFVARLSGELRKSGIEPSAALMFLCRSGVRSRAAAVAMTLAGWTRCYNVAGGFEGPLNNERHRGGTSGWKAAGLPWVQS